jgi:hypothetical protein
LVTPSSNAYRGWKEVSGTRSRVSTRSLGERYKDIEPWSMKEALIIFRRGENVKGNFHFSVNWNIREIEYKESLILRGYKK